MKALLLAAGLGTRLRPLTDSVPKCLVPIQGKPLLQYWLDLLDDPLIDRVIINTHYLPLRVTEFISKQARKYPIEIAFEPVLLGTGGTVLKHIKKLTSDSFFVAHADNLTIFDIGKFIQRHLERPSDVSITMMTFDTDTPESCGIVVTNSKGIVTEFFEKVPNPPSRHANAAVYIFDQRVMSFLKKIKKTYIDISIDVLPNFLGAIQTHHNSSYHRDIGSPESLARAERDYPSAL